MKATILCAWLAIAAVQGFILDDLHGPGGHLHLLDRCSVDADCNGGCCHTVTGLLSDHKTCGQYLLPGAYCDTVSPKGCGCMSGYYCKPQFAGSIAVEPSTHLKGSCVPVNGTASGPQIAVEGGR